MTFEPEAFQRCVRLVENRPPRKDSLVCSPHLKEEYRCGCDICMMDKNLYDLVLEHLVDEMFELMDEHDRKYNAGQRCDMKKGPCSCGAWH